jgi:hypothetical protein
MEADMTSGRFGALVLGMTLGSLVGVAAAAQSPPSPSPELARSGTAEVTGTFKGYSSKWMNVWTADNRRLRFEVDERSVPGWQKRFKFGDQVTVTYRNLSSRHVPMVIGIRKADGSPKKK